MPNDLNLAIGARIAELRKARALTQEKLADIVGLGQAQTISTIESGERGLKASEVVRFARALSVSPLVLLQVQPALPVPVIRWRLVRDEIPQKNEEGLFVDRCQRYGFLERITGASAPRPLPSYELDIVATSYEQVGTWAEWVRNELGLGELPAPALRETLENVAGVKVFLAALSGGSGAATRGDFGPAILVNGAESVERQAYSLAHELFHLLTWSAMPPEGEALSVEYERRNEQLANVFASNLLLPAERLLQRLGPGTLEGRRVIELEGLAREFGVSLPALLYRLVNLGRLDRDTASRLIEDPTRGRARLPEENRRVCGLPGRYVTLAFQAYVDGLISTGKLAYLLETSIGQLPEVLAEHGFDLDTDAYQAKVLSA